MAVVDRRLDPVPVKALSVLLVSLAATGCYCSHAPDMPRDAGTDARSDAGASPDAPSDADVGSSDYWVLERRDAQLSAPLAACDPIAGSPVVVRVTVPIRSDCEYGGPVSTESVAGDVVLTAHVWVRVPTDATSCAPTTATVERHARLSLSTGPQRVVTDDGGSELQIVVQPAPGSECGSRSAGQTCASDCDCRGPTYVCLPSLDESGACQRVCGQPCDLHNAERPAVYGTHFDCAGQSCRQLAGSGAPTCEAYEGVGCHEEGCPRGLSCRSSDEAPQACGWGPGGSGGGTCTDGRDCPAGTLCVQSDGSRFCQEPCFTNQMPCSSPGSQCVQGGPDPRWICDHVGP